MPPLRAESARNASSSRNPDSRRGSFSGAPGRSSSTTSGRLGDGRYLRAPECAQTLGRAHVWGPEGAFKTSPRLRAPAYKAHVHRSGFAIPCAYALLPNKTAETYASTWVAIRANIGQEASDSRSRSRFATILSISLSAQGPLRGPPLGSKTASPVQWGSSFIRTIGVFAPPPISQKGVSCLFSFACFFIIWGRLGFALVSPPLSH